MKYTKPTIEIVKLELDSMLLGMSDPNNSVGEKVQYSNRKDFDSDLWDDEEDD